MSNTSCTRFFLYVAYFRSGYGFHEDGLKAGILAANGLLGKSCTLKTNPKHMVPSLLETGARLLVTRFLGSLIATGSLMWVSDNSILKGSEYFAIPIIKPVLSQFTGRRRYDVHLWRHQQEVLLKSHIENSYSTVLLEGKKYSWYFLHHSLHKQ